MQQSSQASGVVGEVYVSATGMEIADSPAYAQHWEAWLQEKPYMRVLVRRKQVSHTWFVWEKVEA